MLPGGLTWNLDVDLLFLYTLSSNPHFAGFLGTIDGNGYGLAFFNLPVRPELLGYEFYTAGVLIDASAGAFVTVSNAHFTQVQR